MPLSIHDDDFMEPSSFFCTEEHERVDTGDNPSVCNRHAGDDAHVFVLSLMCIVAGLVVADSAADGMMIECAQIERAAETRTAVVVNCFILRVIGASLGSCLLATGFNSYKHLGFFDSDLSLTMFYGIICAVATFSVLLWVVASNAEQPHSQMVPCSRCCAFLHGSTWNSYVAFSRCDTAAKHAGKMLRLFCAKPFFKFMLFNIFSLFERTSVPLWTSWCGVTGQTCSRCGQQVTTGALRLSPRCLMHGQKPVCSKAI